MFRSVLKVTHNGGELAKAANRQLVDAACANLLLGGAVICAAGSVLVYPFLRVGNVKY